MMILCGRYLLGLLLALTLIQSATGLWWRDRIFAQVVRPTVEYLIERQLQAEVHIDKLALSSTQLRLSHLSIEKSGSYRVSVAEAELRFSLDGLWHRQLKTIRLQQPRVEILGLQKKEHDTPADFPDQPPLEIADLRVVDGTVLLNLGGQRRWIHSIQVDLNGTRSPRFQAGARLGEGEGLPISLTGTGNWDRRPGLTLSRLIWDGASLLEEPLQFQLDRSGTRISGSARLPRLSRIDLERIAGILALPLELPDQLDFFVESPEIILSLQPAELEMQLNIPAAEILRGTTKLLLGPFYSTLHRKDAVWTATGRFTLEKMLQSTFNATYAEPHQLTGEFTCVADNLDTLIGRFARDWKKMTTGGGMLKGEFSSREGKTVFRASISGRPTPGPKQNYSVDISPLQIRMTAELNGDILKGEGKVLLAGRELADFSGSEERLQLKLKQISWNDIRTLAGPDLLPASLEEISGLSGTANLQRNAADQWQGRVEVAAEHVKATGGELKDLTVGGKFSRKGQGIELRDLRLVGRATLPEGGCRISVAGDAILENSAFRVDLTSLTITDGDFFSSDGTSGVVGGTVRGSATLSGDVQKPQIDFDLKAGFGVSEVLHGPYYANLIGNEGQLGLRGTFNSDTRRLSAEQMTLAIPGLLAAQGHGSVSADAIVFNGSIHSSELGGAFDRYFKSPLDTAASKLKDLSLSGTLNADFILRKEPESFSIFGSLNPQDLGLKLAGPDIDIAGLHGHVPLAYATRMTDTSEKPLEGQLRFNSIKAGPAWLENTPIHLLSSTNRVQIKEWPKWNMAGGRLRIFDLDAAIEADQPKASARILISDIDLARLTQELGWVGMRGDLNADLGEIRYAAGELSSAGQATISAFGGSMVVSNIRLRDIGSPYRTLNGDIDLRGIDIYLLTRTFEFGEMNGIVDGHIHNLRLFGSTPSQFAAELATRQEGRRNISVKALNNLSILSQGGLSAALSRGIYQFIDFYRYQKIGVRCTLNNDIFHLTGTARSGSDEYLVYGGLLPPKINIIAPGRDISFKEMLKRLSRIDRAGR